MILKSKEEMQCLLYIYCGYLDNDFCSAEIDLVMSKFGQSLYSELLVTYHNHPQHKILEWILIYFNANFKTKSDRLSIRKEIIELCEVDGNFCRFEKSFLGFMDLYMEKASA